MHPIQSRIEVQQGSVTDSKVDVFVNASNTIGRLGTGVSAAIRRACGAGFQGVIDHALQQRGGPTAPGAVWLTHAGTHPRAHFVAHVAVMDYRQGAPQVHPDAARIEHACGALWEGLETLSQDRLSIGMVALGASTGGLGERLPTELAHTTLRAHLAQRETTRTARVVFFGFTLLEHANIADVVDRHFDVDVPEDVRALGASLRG
jgi:O-acetyl-ADP-ribose deacetylase (regulator of RNase III)